MRGGKGQPPTFTGAADDPVSSRVELHVVPVDSERAHRLERRQITEMAERYGGAGPAPLRGEEFEGPRGCFVVATIDGTDVACGGFRPLGRGVAEIKRMYVDPAVRRRGIGARVLAFLEEQAVAEGYRETWLETGTAQPDAITMYVSAGYRARAPYGEFKEDPRNRCFSRRLVQ
ncbi:MAG: GNAT family N-acetyltransferase [Acidimicrobiales bacterium]|jgi:GNAT superfamily N-acetyltransferase